MRKPEIYVSTDVEADGPIPGPHSMLSFGSAAYLADKTLISTFAANLETLPGANGHPNTMAWWAQNKTAWDACRVDSPLRPLRGGQWTSLSPTVCGLAHCLTATPR